MSRSEEGKGYIGESENAWVQDCDRFVHAACQHYHIKPPASRSSASQCTTVIVKLPVSFETCPPLPPHPNDSDWDSLERRLWVQVDCKSVADVCNGVSVLKAPHLEPIFRRVVQTLYDVSTRGWRPRRDVDPVVLWSPRELNTPADHMVNAAMDTGRNWTWKDEDLLRAASGLAVKICVDGGLRRQDTRACPGAFGCAAYARMPDGSHRPFLLAGLVVHGMKLAFHADASALEWTLSQCWFFQANAREHPVTI